MVDMYCPPYQTVLICHLVGVRDPFYEKGALPPGCQLIGALRRRSHHEDEITFVIRVSSHRSWRWGHLLVSEGQALSHRFYIGSWILWRRGSAHITLEVWGQSRLSPSGNHGRQKTMGLMDHGVQRQHDAGDLIYPVSRRNILKQASPEHIVYGPMAPLVDGVTFGMVGRG